MSDERAFAELHYTDFGTYEAFEKLTREHGLEYSDNHPDAGPGATSHVWRDTDGLELWTAQKPTQGHTGEVITADGVSQEDQSGYASYVYVCGPAGATETLWREIIDVAVYVKGEFQPLQIVDGQEIASYWEVVG